MIIKVIYILSNISHAPSYQWIAKGLNTEKFNLSFIFLNPKTTELEKEIKNLGIRVYHIPFSGKKDYIKAWFKCYRLLRSTGPDIVHCHLFDANIIGLSAAKAAGIKKRIHTRHHGDLHPAAA